MPNYLLQWEAIRWAHERGARLYDFLGVPREPDPQHPVSGLYRFKSAFSATRESFVGEFDVPLRPVLYLLWRLADPVVAHAALWGTRFRRVVFRPRRLAHPEPSSEAERSKTRPEPETAPQS
jgi:hypothetical protein